MTTIELSELEQRVGQVLHEAQEAGETVGVTERGRLLAYVVPVQQSEPASSRGAQAFLDELDAFAEEIGQYWPEGVSAVDAVKDVRG